MRPLIGSRQSAATSANGLSTKARSRNCVCGTIGPGPPQGPPDQRMMSRSSTRGPQRRPGRRPGLRWGPRVLDLDIILWSEGPWGGPGPIVPHIAFRERDFVLEPLAEIAPDWRDPVTGLNVRQLRFRLTAPRPAPRSSAGQGP